MNMLSIILPVFLAGILFISSLKAFPSLLKYPLDLGLKINRKRIFGENKTIRGPLFMGIFTGLFGLIIASFISIKIEGSVFLSYFAIGVLYSIGELPNSFVKRQMGILPGKNAGKALPRLLFFFLDTYDSLIFCGIGYILFFSFPFNLVVASVLLGGIVHLCTDLLMKFLNLK